MRILGKFLTAFLLFFFLCTVPSTADIKSFRIRSHNTDIIHLSDFEFSQTGYVSFAVSSVEYSSIPITSTLSSQPDPSRIGFFLLSKELQLRYNLESRKTPNLCALDIKFITVLFTFKDLSPPPHSSFNKSYHVTFPGDYSVYFTNCNDLSLVTMDVRTELYNTDDDGTTKDYLSADQTQPSFYVKYYFVYSVFLGFWVSLCFKNRRYFQRLHLLMTLLLVLTVLHCICKEADQQDLKVTGTHYVWHVWSYIFQLNRNVVFLSIIVLIGARWCTWQPSFSEWTLISSLTIVILLQVLANLCYMEVGEYSGVYDLDWNLKACFYLLDILSCIFVFLHIFFLSLEFKEAKDISTFVRSFDSLEMNSARPDVLSVLFLVYMIFLRYTTVETGNFVFYTVMFYMFRPFGIDHEGKKCGDSGVYVKYTV